MMDISLPIRALQLFFAVLVLGFTAYEASWYNDHTVFSSSPSPINFLIFTALFTILCLFYLTLAPRFAAGKVVSHPYAFLGVNALLWVFWFAGWVRLARFHTVLNLCFGTVCNVMVAAIVVGALEWVTFFVTLALAALAARAGTTGTTNGAKWPGSTHQTTV